MARKPENPYIVGFGVEAWKRGFDAGVRWARQNPTPKRVRKPKGFWQ